MITTNRKERLNAYAEEYTNGYKEALAEMAPAPNSLDALMEDSNQKFENYITEQDTPVGKYQREVLPGAWVDVYDIISAFGVTDGGFQHALKKILACGQRGHKDEAEDRKDIELSIKRSNEIYTRGR